MNYCIVDESDPSDFLECEGKVLSTFFTSSRLFNSKNNLELIRQNKNIEESIKKRKVEHYNVFQFSAHGSFVKGTKNKLDQTSIWQRRRNREDVEIFRPDSVVRIGLKTDLFFSTNCQTFNPHFIDIVRNYTGVSNFIAPVNSPHIGNTLIFSMMFYNLLFRKVRKNAVTINDALIIESFIAAKKSYKNYNDVEYYNRQGFPARTSLSFVE